MARVRRVTGPTAPYRNAATGQNNDERRHLREMTAFAKLASGGQVNDGTVHLPATLCAGVR
ncbi:MAG: hypothetical protein NVS3B18_01650 [Candidatus Dormibacteria bacterium]